MSERVTGSTQAVTATVTAAAELRGKTVVVKYGGNAMTNDVLKAAVMQDIIAMTNAGIRTVLVHGGGPEIDAMLKKTGKESRFVNGLRYTDSETMDIVQMVLCGKVNKDICALIQKAGGSAIGLCGIDGALLKARRMNADGEAELGLVGEVEAVDTRLINAALELGVTPVISSVAYGTGGDDGRPLNVNADIAAAKIAGALGAEKLLLMTDVRGILRDINDPASLIKEVTRTELDTLKQDGIVSGGMIPKTDCCIIALDAGVKTTHIIDGRQPHALLTELFSNGGIGTMIQGA
jgi:acetylglutamate kinase